jgi:hypothetical protein
MERETSRPRGATGRFWIVLAPLLASAVSLSVLAWAGRDGWSGDADLCVARDGCYCEEFRDGLIRQPVNTWSCMAFVFAGLLCAVHAMRNHDPRGGRLASTVIHPAVFATSMVLIGPASMALHASMTKWGGEVDGFSMNVFAAYCLALGLSRRFGWNDTRLWTLALLGAVIPIGFRLIPGFPIRREIVFGLSIGIFILNEILPEGRTRPLDRRWSVAAMACLFAGIVAWSLSIGPASPLCQMFGGRGFLQGHALWHCLTAAATACLYPHLRKER